MLSLHLINALTLDLFAWCSIMEIARQTLRECEQSLTLKSLFSPLQNNSYWGELFEIVRLVSPDLSGWYLIFPRVVMSFKLDNVQKVCSTWPVTYQMLPLVY